MEWPDVEDLLEYWQKSPPVHVILGAVHFPQEQKQYKPLTEDEALAQFSEAVGVLGEGEALPPHIRKMTESALAQQKKLKSSLVN